MNARVFQPPTPAEWDEMGAWFEGIQRRVRLKARKEWTEKWFAYRQGMTVQQWREAQMRVRGLTLEQVKP